MSTALPGMSLTKPSSHGQCHDLLLEGRSPTIGALAAQNSQPKMAATTAAMSGLATIPLQKSRVFLPRQPPRHRKRALVEVCLKIGNGGKNSSDSER